jgi:arabinofuranan 3-O-arabinosyltransferase
MAIDSLVRRFERPITVVAWALAVAAGWLSAQHALKHGLVGHGALGLDLRPVLRAGRAALAGTDLYAVAGFVYPPPAALLAAPLTRLPYAPLAIGVMVVHLAVIAAVAAWSVRSVLRGAGSWALAGLVAAALVGGGVTRRGLWLENTSVLLAGVLVLVLGLWGRGRWGRGTVLLALSLLVKPLLLAVLLVPVVARRWRAIVVAAVVSAVVLLASAASTSGLSAMPAVVRRLLRGSVLVGSLAHENLALPGVVEAFGLPTFVLWAGRVVVLLVVLAAAVVQVRDRGPWDVPRLAAASGLLLAAIFLAGTLSEVHYLYALVPAVVCVGLTTRSTAARAASAVAAVCLVWPRAYGGPSGQQLQLVLAEVAVLVAASVVLTARRVQAPGR